MDIAFVIPAYNEAACLPATLRAIHEAASPLGVSYDVIVADDASTDDTAAIARAGGARVVPCANRKISATRNVGARASDSRWIIFVDADTLVSRGAIRGAVEALRQGAAGGSARIVWEGEVPRYARILMPVLNAWCRVGRAAPGAFIFCTREAYDATGGWDQSFYAAEEIFFSRALRRQGRWVWVKSAVRTSGRKLRAYSGREIAWHLVRLFGSGRRGMQSAKGKELWYAEQRRGEEAAPVAGDE